MIRAPEIPVSITPQQAQAGKRPFGERVKDRLGKIFRVRRGRGTATIGATAGDQGDNTLPRDQAARRANQAEDTTANATQQPAPTEEKKATKNPLIYIPDFFNRTSVLNETTVAREQIINAHQSLQEQKAPQQIIAIFNGRSEKVEHSLHAVEAILELDQSILELDQSILELDESTLSQDQKKQVEKVQNVFKDALTPLAKAYGFDIVKGDPREDDAGYAQRIQQHAQEYNRTNGIATSEQEISFSFTQPEKRELMPDFMNTDYVSAEGEWVNNPGVRSVIDIYTHVLNRYSDLQQTALGFPRQKYKRSSPFSSSRQEAPQFSSGSGTGSGGGLRKMNNLNLYQATNMLFSMGKIILWEGFNGNSINLTYFARYLNEILKALHLHVDVEQTDQANQAQLSTPQQQAGS